MRTLAVLIVTLSVLALPSLPALAQEDVLTIYSGRNESLVGPLLESFSDISGIEIEVLYGGTAGLASQIIEEGENSPADIFIAQDAGALGALAKEGLLAELPEDLLGLVSDPAFVSPEGLWLALSGRARVLVYGPDALGMAGLELPESILDLTGRIITSWEDPGDGGATFSAPHGIWVDPEGAIYMGEVQRDDALYKFQPIG